MLIRMNKIACRGALLALCLIAPTLARGGDFKSLRVPTDNSQPRQITLGSDGNLWFTEPFNNKIGRVTPLGVITEFALPSSAQPRDIVAGPDDNLWFTEFLAGQIARITTAGIITEIQKVRGGPWGIGRGAGGTIWVTQMNGNRVARFTVTP